jgi:protein phosphatase
VTLTIPEGSLVLLIGPAGSGKSTFARKHFKSTEIVSSDALRAAVSDDEADQSASGDAFWLLRLIAGMRLKRGKLTVIDATNVQAASRKSLLALAQRNSRPGVAIVFNLPLADCLARNEARLDRRVSPEVLEKQASDLAESLPRIWQEPPQWLYVLQSTEDIAAVQILRE